MFAQNFYNSQIVYINDSYDLKRHSEAIPQIFNFQYSMFNSGLSGLGDFQHIYFGRKGKVFLMLDNIGSNVTSYKYQRPSGPARSML